MQQDQYPIIEAKEIKMFAIWRWKAEELNQNCTICRKQMTEPCNECEVNNDQNDDDAAKCIIVQSSNCGHAFHRHCIRGWIQRGGQGSSTQGTCPLCQLNWEINGEVEVEN